MLTLAYNGTEKAIGQDATGGGWGFSYGSCHFRQRDQAVSCFDAVMPVADFSADPVIPFLGAVIVQTDRTGSGTTWTGGRIEFQGKRLAVSQTNLGNKHYHRYQFGDAWWDLENTIYQQPLVVWDSATSANILNYSSEAVLFSRLNTTAGLAAATLDYVTTGQQISDILNFLLTQYAAQGMAAPFQIGTIDPALYMPAQIMKPQSCAAAIKQCLEFHVDCVAGFDYTTTPPTFHARNLYPTTYVDANGNPLTPTTGLPAATLQIAAGSGHNVRGVKINPRPELQARTVIVNYRVTDQTGSIIRTYPVQDKFGPHGANSPLDPSGGQNVIVEDVDLRGYNRTFVSATLNVIAFNAASDSLAAVRAFWSVFHKSAATLRIRQMSFEGLTVLQETGDVDYPANDVTAAILANVAAGTGIRNVLISDEGGLPAWTGYGIQRAEVRASVWFAQYATPSTAADYNADTTGKRERPKPESDDDTVNETWSAQLKFTDAPVGYYTLWNSSTVAGEPIPTGVAKYLYNALSPLHFAGDQIEVMQEISAANSTITLFNLLNLSGGAAAWAAMNERIGEIEKTYAPDAVTVSFGPPKHLDLGRLMTILRAFRCRRVWYPPGTRATAAL